MSTKIGVLAREFVLLFVWLNVCSSYNHKTLGCTMLIDAQCGAGTSGITFSHTVQPRPWDQREGGWQTFSKLLILPESNFAFALESMTFFLDYQPILKPWQAPVVSPRGSDLQCRYSGVAGSGCYLVQGALKHLETSWDFWTHSLDLWMSEN